MALGHREFKISSPGSATQEPEAICMANDCPWRQEPNVLARAGAKEHTLSTGHHTMVSVRQLTIYRRVAK